MPDFLRNAGHLVHTLLTGYAGAVGAVRKLVCVVAQTGNLPHKFRVVCAGARVDFFACNECAQVFLARESTCFDLFAKLAVLALVQPQRNDMTAPTHSGGLGFSPKMRLDIQALCLRYYY